MIRRGGFRMKQWEEQTRYDLVLQNSIPDAIYYPIPIGKVRKRRKRNRKKKCSIISAVSFGIIAAFSFQMANYTTEHFFRGNRSENSIIKTLENAPTNTEIQLQQSVYTGNLTDVVSEAMPFVVSITSTNRQEISNWYGNGLQEFESQSSGSGIIVGQTNIKLMIATNQHVIAGTERLTVGFTSSDGTTFGSKQWGYENDMLVEAQIEGMDEDNDLAVISVNLEEIPKSIRDEIKIATFADPEGTVVGEQVVAIGNALGYGQSVTSGYVSAVNSATRMYIQTDAAINPGNSGGALLNMRGEVIGINSAKISADAVEGMGFAIPASTAVPILERLMT